MSDSLQITVIILSSFVTLMACIIFVCFLFWILGIIYHKRRIAEIRSEKPRKDPEKQRFRKQEHLSRLARSLQQKNTFRFLGKVYSSWLLMTMKSREEKLRNQSYLLIKSLHDRIVKLETEKPSGIDPETARLLEAYAEALSIFQDVICTSTTPLFDPLKNSTLSVEEAKRRLNATLGTLRLNTSHSTRTSIPHPPTLPSKDPELRTPSQSDQYGFTDCNSQERLQQTGLATETQRQSPLKRLCAGVLPQPSPHSVPHRLKTQSLTPSVGLQTQSRSQENVQDNLPPIVLPGDRLAFLDPEIASLVERRRRINKEGKSAPISKQGGINDQETTRTVPVSMVLIEPPPLVLELHPE